MLPWDLWPWAGYERYMKHALTSDELGSLRTLLSTAPPAEVEAMTTHEIGLTGLLPLHAVAREAAREGEVALPFFEALLEANPRRRPRTAKATCRCTTWRCSGTRRPPRASS